MYPEMSGTNGRTDPRFTMTSENGVNFKVFVKQGDDDKPEVRRFAIDRSVVTNFEYMRAKLQSIFPALKNSSFSVSWRDDEGDDVLISSDDELMVALSSMQDDLKKLYVDLNDGMINEEPMEIPEFSPIHCQREHIGVVCDFCNGQVVGYRYKCITCEDFDLCATCEGANKHSEHFMIRIPLPISPLKRRFSRHIGHCLFKTLKKGGAFEGSTGEECRTSKRHCRERTSESRHEGRRAGRFSARPERRPEETQCRQQESAQDGHPRCRQQETAREGHPRCGRQSVGGGGWLNTFATYMNEFANLAGDLNQAPANSVPPSASAAPHQANPNDAAAPASTTTANECQRMQQVHRMYLQNVGQTVARILDPLGIDVDIEVRPSMPAATAQPTETLTASVPVPSAPAPSAPVENPQTPSVPVSGLIQPQRETTLIDVDDMSESNSTRDKSETPERMEGWTILNTEGPEPILPPNPPAGGIGFDFERMTRDFRQQMQMLQAQHLDSNAGNSQTTEARQIYPSIPAHLAQQTAPVQETKPAVVPGSQVATPADYRPQDPKIAAALDTMLAMGFKNDGGRLARLIEKKGGNISAVLDILSMNIP